MSSLSVPHWRHATTPVGPRRAGQAGHRLAAPAAFLLALTYATVLASLPLDAFNDRDNYLRYAAHSWAILKWYWSQGSVALLANEPLWLVINVSLSSVLSPEWTVRTVIFLPAFTVAWLVLRQDARHFIWLIVFLLMAQVIKNHIIHLRQGVAIAIFLCSWLSTRFRTRSLVMVIAAFVHGSFFFLLALYAIIHLARRMRLNPDIQFLIAACAGVAVGLGVGFLASFLGARQAAYYDFTLADVSGLGFIFWAFILLIMLLEGTKYKKDYNYHISVVVFYLSTYFMLEVTARIFESALIPILLAGLSLSNWRRKVFLTMVCAYAVLQYHMRMQAPWLGWGIGAA